MTTLINTLPIELINIISSYLPSTEAISSFGGSNEIIDKTIRINSNTEKLEKICKLNMITVRKELKWYKGFSNLMNNTLLNSIKKNHGPYRKSDCIKNEMFDDINQRYNENDIELAQSSLTLKNMKYRTNPIYM